MAVTHAWPPEGATDRRRVVARLGYAAIVCACALIVLAAVFVGTRTGQRIDNAALEGRVVQSHRIADRSNDVLRTISIGSLTLFGAAIMTVAVVRGRWHLALAVAR